MSSPEICPNCGAEVPPNARACPECGSDEQTGWSDKAYSERLGIPDDEFNYDQFVREEFGQKAPAGKLRPHGVRWFWWLVALGLVLLFVSSYLKLW